MRHSFVFALSVALLASCATKEIDVQAPTQDNVEFYASFEQPAEDGTRVYANEDLLLRWTADDRVSIFNKNTYNQQYRFTGNTGANAGGFSKMESDEFISSSPIEDVVSVYPYQTSTEISESETISISLPAEQAYAENSFGLGANTMVSVTSDNFIKYKNVGGYLMLKLYGQGVSVSSITLKGNNGEKLAGKASVTMPLNGVPSVTMSNEATTEITLACATPVQLGATAEESTQFWFVIPPVTFNKGFTITLNDSLGRTFEQSTSKSITIYRNKLSKMSSLEVVPVLFASKCLTFISEGTTTISLLNCNDNSPVLYYSFDKTNWTQWNYSELTFTSEHPLYFCGDNPDGFSSRSDDVIRYSMFYANGDNISISGSVMSLIDRNHEVTTIPSPYCFYGLFHGCPGLVLAPELPATTLAEACYLSMFNGCTSLMTAPELPATTLAKECYSNMFEGCSSLMTVPELPATSLADKCYHYMFYQCIKLAIAPKLPATTLADHCYDYMFSGCTSLTTAPNLPATTLADYCYSYMFFGCKSLMTPPDLPATSLAVQCYSYMFARCSMLTTPPNLPATTLAHSCYSNMFTMCTKLETAPELPATTLADRCYSYMFSRCTGLTTAPALPATTLADCCYNHMFYQCRSLTQAPELPALTLTVECYKSMFTNCPSLNYVKCLATDISAEGCVGEWLYIVAESGTFVKAPEMNDWPSGSSGIPEGWTVIDDTPTLIPEAVDLGLSVKWASFNLGASKPEDYGDYYAWGDTEAYYSSLDPLTWKEGKEAGYSWASYKWSMGGFPLTKYCTNSSYGYNGFTDDEKLLYPEDDAARMAYGAGWRMPTEAEWNELLTLCTREKTTMNGISGQKFTAPNGNSIFLPDAGFRNSTTLYDAGTEGYYWSSSLYADYPVYAWCQVFFSVEMGRNGYARCNGNSIRPVYAE